ncbi:MAG: SphA family protein, partial [Longimicrobiales bacterium]
GYTLKPRGLPYLSFAAGFPIAHVSVNTDLPSVNMDASGFGDLFVQPFKVGVRLPRFDIVTLYTFYAPTGKFEPRRASVGRGFWTHQFSAGGAAYFNRARTSRASLLASYDINLRKRDIDITRGNTFQLQGGAGIGLLRVATVGIAGYAMWQVTDDRGADVPPVLRGRRSRLFGLGPELAFVVPALRSRFNARYETDFGARARIEGNILVLGIAINAWSPARPGGEVLGR